VLRSRLLGVALAAAVAAPSALAGSDSSSPALLVVSTTADVVNGTVSSPAGLIANPGPDGISLREAITALNGAPGHAITFAPSLAGKTIVESRPMPAFTRDGTALVGLTTAGGEPAVTLDAKEGGLHVFASNVSITHMRFVDVRGNHTAVQVWAGGPGGALDVHGDRVEWNVFDNSGGAPGGAITLGTAEGVPNITGAVESDVTVAHNLIEHISTGDGLLLGMNGTHSTAKGVLVEDNTFTDIANPGADGQGYAALELAVGPSDDHIVGTRILRNSLTGGLGVSLNTGGTPNVSISDTQISQNVFDGASLVINGGTGTGDAIVDTEISEDLMAQDTSRGGAVVVEGGEGGSGNRVDGVSIVNDTFAFNKTALTLVPNPQGATGNQISNVSVENTIFWSNGTDLGGGGPGAPTVAPTISSSLRGIDPHFVSAQDFHLLAGSPAIDAGSSTGGSAVDIEDRTRDSSPDIGAYEFGAAPRPRLAVDLEELGGTGSIGSSPAGIACGTTCDAAFAANAAVSLSAVPASGSTFTGWSGACSGTKACSVTLSGAKSVSATFGPVIAPKPKPAKPKTPKCKKSQRSTKRKPCRK
jgi:hypothetical protein